MNASLHEQSVPVDYTLLDARNHSHQYKALFRLYCTELTQSDPAMAQYDPDELAEENLQSSSDHPYLVEVDGKPVGLVVFMDEDAPEDNSGCHSYVGELFIRKAYRNRGIAGRIAGAYWKAQEKNVGLCYVRGSNAEKFWRRTVEKLGYAYEIFTEDEVRDFMLIRIRNE